MSWALPKFGRSTRLPVGSQFYNLNGTPVALTPLPDGRIEARAFDPWRRWIPIDPLTGPGAPITRQQFEAMVIAIRIHGRLQEPPKEWGQEICDNLNRNALADVPTP
jgi:hypothetical protein